MVSMKRWIICIVFLMLTVISCASVKPLPIDQGSARPGTQVDFKGKPFKLLGSPISVGKHLPSAKLVDAMTMNDVNLSQERGSVLFMSIVTSLDTPVCEQQTHYLGEEGNRLPKEVKRIVISRDTPFAQKRFSQEAKLSNLQYLSDYKEGAFGRSTGLLMDGLMLLARSVIIADKNGVVQYIQVVPEITHLPDMERAFQKAAELATK